MTPFSVAVVSDIHFAGPREKERSGHEAKVIGNPLLRGLVGIYRHHLWLRDVFAHNHLLEFFIDRVGQPDLVIGNGDYSCDTAFIGCVDDAAYESATLCLDRLREVYADRFVSVMGDHELGKKSIFGGAGGMRLASWNRATDGLGIQPFWMRDVGRYRLMGVTSSLMGLSVFDADVLSEEQKGWEELRKAHESEICQAFATVPKDRKILLFCHDPTAIPFLEHLPEVVERLGQIERTIIGHLHSDLILRLSRHLSGFPHVSFMGSTVNRLSGALRDARCWPRFNVILCPSLAGIEMLKDGGYLELALDPAGERPIRIHRRSVPRIGLG